MLFVPAFTIRTEPESSDLTRAAESEASKSARDSGATASGPSVCDPSKRPNVEARFGPARDPGDQGNETGRVLELGKPETVANDHLRAAPLAPDSPHEPGRRLNSQTFGDPQDAGVSEHVNAG